MNWREYQQAAASFFANLGMDVEVEAALQGARASHAVDVAVRFKAFGDDQLWLVECKLWTTTVPKEKVLALQSLLDDLGADRGFLLSEGGFQSGAVTAARLSRITLSSIGDLRQNADEDLRELKWQQLYERMARAAERFRELSVVTRADDRSVASQSKPGVDRDEFFFHFGNLSHVEHGLEAARMRRVPIAYSWIRGEEAVKMARSVPEFLDRASDVMDELERWLNEQIAKPWPNKPSPARGGTLRPPRLRGRERVDSVRRRSRYSRFERASEPVSERLVLPRMLLNPSTRRAPS